MGTIDRVLVISGVRTGIGRQLALQGAERDFVVLG